MAELIKLVRGRLASVLRIGLGVIVGAFFVVLVMRNVNFAEVGAILDRATVMPLVLAVVAAVAVVIPAGLLGGVFAAPVAGLPDVGVLVLSAYVEEQYALELVQDSAEGVGYLLKDRVADVREFVDAVVRVAGGGTALDPEVVQQLLSRSRRGDVLAGLTPREREVLGLMAEGRTNAAIARQLVVSDGAVEKHVSNIFLKLGLAQSPEDHRRVLAVLAFLET